MAFSPTPPSSKASPKEVSSKKQAREYWLRSVTDESKWWWRTPGKSLAYLHEFELEEAGLCRLLIRKFLVPDKEYT